MNEASKWGHRQTGSDFARLPSPLVNWKLTLIKLNCKCARIKCFYSLIIKQTSNRNFSTSYVCNLDREAKIFFERALITFIWHTMLVFCWYSFYYAVCLFQSVLEEGLIVEEFLWNCFFCRSNMCCFALNYSSECCWFNLEYLKKTLNSRRMT